MPVRDELPFTWAELAQLLERPTSAEREAAEDLSYLQKQAARPAKVQLAQEARLQAASKAKMAKTTDKTDKAARNSATDFEDKLGNVVTPEMRLRLYPLGCPRCRNRKGCTRSCWLLRRLKDA